MAVEIKSGRPGDSGKLVVIRLRCPVCGRFVCTGLRYCSYCDVPGRRC